MKPKRSLSPNPAFILNTAHFGSQKAGEQTDIGNHRARSFPIFASWLAVAVDELAMAITAKSQCPLPLSSGLQGPIGIVQSNTGDLLVSESGLVDEKSIPVPNTGLISIVNRGGRRTLLRGLPSGISDQGGVSGTAGLFLRGRTLYVAIGAGDAAVAGPTCDLKHRLAGFGSFGWPQAGLNFF